MRVSRTLATGKGPMRISCDSLKTMNTDHLDLWQMHDMRTEEDIEDVTSPRGALKAFVEAKENGLVRFIGVTGHENPSILRRCIELADFDTVLMPVNPAEPQYLNFIEDLMPFALQKDMGVIAMKVYIRGMASRIPGIHTMEPFYRFALSHPVTTAIIGCDTTAHLEENVRRAKSFTPMKAQEMGHLSELIAPYARRLMYYKP